MAKQKVLVLAVVCMGVCFLAGSIYAGTSVPDVIKMESKGYKKHTKGIVEFTHKKHNVDYKIGCGECHHDANGKPLTDLKAGDDVKPCIACHKIPGKMPGSVKKEMRASKASKKEIDKKALEYQAEAMHENCISCHKAYDKKNKTKAAPTSCTKCHPKNK